MLLSLSLKNFILARTLEINFDQGFGVLTGETGAGKSILLDALQYATGARADNHIIREGEERAEVSAHFSIPPQSPIDALLQEWAIDREPALILRRVIDRSGRNKAFINGSVVTLAQLSEIGEQLIDIHGQHDSMKIMRPAAQRELLDVYGNTEELVKACAQAWAKWQALIQQLAQSEQEQQSFVAKRELLMQKHEDLREVLSEEDWRDLNRQQQKLTHVQTLQSECERALALLSEEEINVETLLNQSAQSLATLAAIDPPTQEIHALIESAQNEVGEAIRALRHYQANIESDPETLSNLDEQIRRQWEIARKYREKPENLVAMRSLVAKELSECEEGLNIQALRDKTAQAQQHYLQSAQELSRKRHQHAQKMAERVSVRLPSLGMKQAQFRIVCAPIPPGPSGMDAVEFQVSGLAGGQWQALSRVASGGELSRLALALFLAVKGGAPKTFIFDEVDAGIGGAVAESVGRMLAELSADSGQILCVTHLPQVAVWANWHALVRKHMHQQSAESEVEPLHAQSREQEIARMLGGATLTQATREHAREMLTLAKIKN